MRHGTEPLRRSSGSYEGNLELILVMGWERELNSLRPNLPLFLSSSVVERSAVNRLVVGSNPTWGDLIHSELKNSEWKGSLWPLRVGNPFPVSLFLLHSISSYQILFCDIWESPSIPRCRSGIILCSTVWVYLQLANSEFSDVLVLASASLMQSSILPRGHNYREQTY